MSIVINHQTNDLSIAGGGAPTIGGSAAGGGGGPVRLDVSAIAGFTQVPPIDLGYYHSSGLNLIQNETFYVPWVAPLDGTIDGMSVYFSTNNVTTSVEVAMGIYSNSAGPSSRLSYGTFDPNGTGIGWKSITGLSQSVTKNTIYWLAISTNATSALIQCRSYRRNGFYPRPATATVNDDRSINTSSQQISSMTTVPYVGSTSNEPFLLTATYS